MWYHSPTTCGGPSPRTMLDAIVDRNEDVYTRMCPISLMGEDKQGHGYGSRVTRA